MLAPISNRDRAFEEGQNLLGDLIQGEDQSFSGFERNRFFQNLGDGRFVEAGAVVGADLIQDGRGVATGDLDGDGDLDLVVSNRNSPNLVVLRNDVRGAGNYLAVNTVGTRSNRQGIGTRLTVRCGGREQVAAVQLGTGFVSQGAQTAWFGLGDCQTVDSLEVRWPTGLRQTVASPPINKTITVTEEPGGSGPPASR